MTRWSTAEYLLNPAWAHRVPIWAKSSDEVKYADDILNGDLVWDPIYSPKEPRNEKEAAAMEWYYYFTNYLNLTKRDLEESKINPPAFYGFSDDILKGNMHWMRDLNNTRAKESFEDFIGVWKDKWINFAPYAPYAARIRNGDMSWMKFKGEKGDPAVLATQKWLNDVSWVEERGVDVHLVNDSRSPLSWLTGRAPMVVLTLIFTIL